MFGAAGTADVGGDTAPPGRRISELDALRGLALCGIIFVNISQVMNIHGVVDGQVLPVRHALDLFVHERFFPVFATLFGVGFGIFLRRAASRTAWPRVPLLLRFAALGVFGLLHHVLQPGEALLPYAIGGFVVLLPFSWFPWWVNLPAGAVLVVLSVTLASGGMASVPGLLLLGFGLAQAGVPEALHRSTGKIAAVFAGSAVLSAGALVWQEQDPLSVGFTSSSAVAGLCLSLAYTTGLLLVLKTPAGRVVSGALEPFGRMALTNYLTATLLFVPLGYLLGLPESTSWGAELGLAAAILAVQIVWSRLWLDRFRYGPLEWVWRCVTWRQLVPMRRAPEAV
ncbi:DUF418 domain-containing protein [Saccharopolyspora rosea]